MNLPFAKEEKPFNLMQWPTQTNKIPGPLLDVLHRESDAPNYDETGIYESWTPVYMDEDLYSCSLSTDTEYDPAVDNGLDRYRINNRPWTPEF